MDRKMLESKKLSDLKEIATTLGISIDGLKKAQIVDAIVDNSPAAGNQIAVEKEEKTATEKTPRGRKKKEPTEEVIAQGELFVEAPVEKKKLR